MQLLKQDSERAIELLFEEYYGDLCRSAYRILPDQHLVEDLVQEVFYELWRRRRRLRIKSSLKAYLRRATRNKTLNYLRDHRRVYFEPADAQPLPGNLSGALRQLEAAELQELIDQAIDRLPERCRLVFVLSRFEDMTYHEIAEQLEISVKTVENQVSKALRLLRQALAPYLIHGLLALWSLLG